VKRAFLIICIIIYFISIQALVRIVNPQDPNAFQTIASAVLVTSFSDTVLVYPGVYHENINISGKNIHVYSLFATTADSAYIHNTIIDGSQNGTTIKIFRSFCRISGFTIQNGYGIYSDPGGIQVKESTEAIIMNCIIRNNTSEYCPGGIFVRNTSYLQLINCEVYNNSTLSMGGGLGVQFSASAYLENSSINSNFAGGVGGVYVGTDCQIVFSDSLKNSVYQNNGTYASDIRIDNLNGINPLIQLKQFTVQNPDQYFIMPADSLTIIADSYTDVLTDADMYVSLDGDDSNDGLSPETALKSIYLGLRKIASPESGTRTLHLANGVYSPENQWFPIGVKHNINIQGESMDNTILDGLNQRIGFNGFTKSNLNAEISGLTIKSGMPISGSSANFFYNINLRMNHVRVSDCMGDGMDALFVWQGKFYMNNCIVENTRGSSGIRFGRMKDIRISNSIFRNNRNYSTDPWEGQGRALYIFGFYASEQDTSRVVIDNVLFDANRSIGFGDWPPGDASALVFLNVLDAKVINCTFVNNMAGGYVINCDNTTSAMIRVYNSLFYNNFPALNSIVAYAGTFYVNNSLIQHVQAYNNGEIVMGEGNFNLDPLFYHQGDYPYSISATSPCIDSGTLNIPGYVFPETDLAGNPRLVGTSVDIGAYEWDALPVTEETLNKPNPKMSVYPNPFNPSTTISWQMPEEGEVEVSIFNIKGQKVKTLCNQRLASGQHQIVWDGKEYGSGVYFVRLQAGNQTLMRKILMMK